MKYKLNIYIFLLAGICCGNLFSQYKQHKLSEKIAVDKDVRLTLNTSHTNIVFESWDKNTIAVEAYLEGDIENENNKRILDSWHVLGNEREVTITSTAGNLWTGNVTASNIEIHKNNLKELQVLSPFISDMLGPIMENLNKNPMPSTLSDNVASVNYGNKKKYNQEEEKYIQQWEDQIREKFSEEMKEKNWKPNSNPSISNQTPIETWGEAYGRQMDAWASQLLNDIVNQQSGVANVTVYQYTTSKINTKNTSKVLKIRIPKASKLQLNIRHGKVKLAERVENLKASLSHTTLSGNIIDGNQTFIKASYSPIYVREWNHGKLAVNYVKNCRIQTANNLLVNADSSSIYIQKLNQNGAISGSFGVITIESLGETFSTLDLVLQNSDFNLNLPKSAFNLSYSGAQSLISLPRTLEINTRRNFGNVFINGFQNTRSTDRMITINAKYSEVILKGK